MTNVADNSELEPRLPVESPGGEQATDQGPVGPFFDPETIDLPIEELSLKPLENVRKWDSKSPEEKANTTKNVVHFFSSAICGNISAENFADIYSRVIGRMLEKRGPDLFGPSTEEFDDLYDTLERLHPRLNQLLSRVRSEEYFSSEVFASVVKYTLLAVAIRDSDTYHS